ncbi:TPA: hypothetical protein N0F65_002315 [Lagenidium giganteum]|uniref:C2H2-type domain-containing protein n=1 Tax=Lagenidium giganteum TaxID=4803 RepID=A0AAV2Z618_9STRA|nr:TPA: hypothetical protein N0F65_002315 [Lagenidium giganteum]
MLERRDMVSMAAALFATVWIGQVGSFLWTIGRCSFPVLSAGDGVDNSLRVLIFSDMHLWDRSKTWMERVWVDWQLYLSLQTAIETQQPDVIIVLGDQFDKGGLPTTDDGWALGNHDSSFGRDIEMREVNRFELTFGPANRIAHFKGHTFVQVNTLALDSDVTHADVASEAKSWLSKLMTHDNQTNVVLLTHMPLHRDDDRACGWERLQEENSTNVDPPSHRYKDHHDVLSANLSSQLLTSIKPNIVLSGHTHAWCQYQHANTTAIEFTIPTASWGQRQDPGYAVMTLRGSSSAVRLCHLPSQLSVLRLMEVVVELSNGKCRRKYSPSHPLFDAGNRMCIEKYYRGIDPAAMMEDDDDDDSEDSAHWPFQCRLFACRVDFKTIGDYEEHYDMNVCSECQRSFLSARLLDIHITETHDAYFKILSKRQPMYRCLVDGCTEVYRSSDKRDRHLTQDHAFPPTLLHKPRKARNATQGTAPAKATSDGQKRRKAKQKKKQKDQNMALNNDAAVKDSTNKLPRSSSAMEEHEAMEDIATKLRDLKIPKEISFGRRQRRI